MFKHKGVHQCTWHQDTLGRRSMIDFVVVSSDLRPSRLGHFRVKRGAELSTDHHLVVSWLRWQRRKLDRPGRPKRIVRVCWERLAEPSVREVFNSHLRKSFSQIPREAGDIESEWTMFSASIVDDACSSKLWTLGRSLVPVVVAIGGNPRTRWWTPEVRDAVRLKKESYRTMLACGTPDAVDRYRQAKQAAARRSWRQKLGSGRSSVRPWRRTIVRKQEAGDSEVDSSITRAEVTEVVRKLLGGKAPGVDEIRPEYLKSLDVVGLSWLTRLCNIAWRLGTVPLEWQTGVVVPLFKKGDRRVCSNYRGITLLSLPGKVYARVLERRIRPIVDPWIQEEQCGFRPGRGTVDQLYTLHRVLGGFMGVCPTSPHVLCGSGEGIRPCPSWYSVGSAPRVWGPGAFAKGCSVSVRPEQELGSHCRQISRRSQGPEGVRFGNHRISSLLFADDVVLLASSSQDLQHVLERFAAECEGEAAGMRISTSKSEAMVLDRKRVACPLRVGGEVLPQVEEFKYLGVLFTSEGKMEREIDRRIDWCSVHAVMRVSVYRTVVVKKELRKG
ncbi:hypothetical protein L3Q82_004334 [Scortum barcoo]|uniref:Uncharacterized protein n=1 Tax=Scortum barcoo TaxID=214431 RepID=A0ACB8VLI8_9TELE|nr:hypothetical protein L3Q82_004334 [Scortum barcoo]